MGHGVEGIGEGKEVLPRLVEALAGNKVIGAAAGQFQTVVWTDAGELFTCGQGGKGVLGHGGEDNELLPRLVEALVGKKVIGAAAGSWHTVVWTEAGELFTFGSGDYQCPLHAGLEWGGPPLGGLGGRDSLGQGGGDEVDQWGHSLGKFITVPKRVEALAAKKVAGASAGRFHTVVWTDEMECFTFGCGSCGELGHGESKNESVPRQVHLA